MNIGGLRNGHFTYNHKPALIYVNIGKRDNTIVECVTEAVDFQSCPSDTVCKVYWVKAERATDHYAYKSRLHSSRVAQPHTSI